MRALLAGLLLVAACAGPSGPPLSLTLDQSRDLENRHLLAVRLVNDGGSAVEVVRLQLRSDAWTSVAPTVREEVLAPGRRLAFPVAYGAAVCGRTGPADVVVGYRRDGALQETRVRVPADDPLLARLHDRECALQALARDVDVSFGPWTRRGGTATSEVVLTRLRGDEPVALTAVDGSVIFTVRTDGGLPLALTGEAVSVPVEAAPTRCDPHALAESKRTFDFALAVAVGDAPPLTVQVRPEPADVPLLQQLVLDVCL